jgi:hypothetical protein
MSLSTTLSSGDDEEDATMEANNDYDSRVAEDIVWLVGWSWTSIDAEKTHGFRAKAHGDDVGDCACAIAALGQMHKASEVRTVYSANNLPDHLRPTFRFAPAQ